MHNHKGLIIGAWFALTAALCPLSGAQAQDCGQQNPNCIVPTAPPGTNNNQAASTQFVQTATSIANGITALTGDGTATGPGSAALTLKTVNANVGSFGSATQCVAFTTNAKGLITAASVATCTPAIANVTGLGTGVGAALANNLNAAGGLVGFNGAFGNIAPTPTRAGDVIYWNGTTWVTLPGNNSGTQFLQETSAGAPSWAAAPGTGTVTSATCNGLAITSSGTCPEAFGFANASLAASVSANALTIALKDNSGNDPSATSLSRFSFRNSTLTTGTPVLDSVTAALSVTVPSGQTLGTSNNVPFRFWVVAIDNAGTVALGVINASASGTIFPIPEANLISTTAIASAPAAGVFYSTAALTSKAFAIIGYVEYSSGLATAGTYASGPTEIQTYRAGVRKPGEIVQIGPVGTLTTQGTNTAATYTSTGLSTTITPTSKVNYVSCQASGVGGPVTVNDLGFFQIMRGGINVGLGHQMFAAAADFFIDINLSGMDAPGSTGTLTYTVFDAVGTAGHSIIFPASSGVFTVGGSIGCVELQG